MNQVSEQIKKANQTGVETFETVANAALLVMERLAALNLGTVRGLMEQRESSSRRILAARDPQTLFSIQAKALLEDSRQAMDYSQRAFDISTQTRSQMTGVFERDPRPSLKNQT